MNSTTNGTPSTMTNTAEHRAQPALIPNTPDRSTRPVISVIGLGKLGSPMAACFAASGFRVIGVDTDPDKVSALNEGIPPVEETALEETIRAGRANLFATLDLRSAVLESEVTFIMVPTPSAEDGAFSLDYVLPVCKSIGTALREKDRPHLVCLCSTVMPGATAGPIRTALEMASGRKIGAGDGKLGLCYSPEFIALGSVIHDFQHPDFLLIGESDTAAGDLLQSIYAQTMHNEPHYARMNFVNAELTKIAVNSFITTKITYANMIAGICQRTPHANVDVVTQAVGRDSRIGRKYLKGAVGFGGPCFPRDNVALARAAEIVSAQADLVRTVDTINRLETKRLTQLVTNALADLSELNETKAHAVGILGLAYKPNTEVTEQAQGILLAQELIRKGKSVLVFDPEAMPSAREMLGGTVHYCASLQECARTADVLVIVTPWEEFKNLTKELQTRDYEITGHQIIIDCWRLLDLEAITEIDHLQYRPLGIGQIPEAETENKEHIHLITSYQD